MPAISLDDRAILAIWPGRWLASLFCLSRLNGVSCENGTTSLPGSPVLRIWSASFNKSEFATLSGKRSRWRSGTVACSR